MITFKRMLFVMDFDDERELQVGFGGVSYFTYVNGIVSSEPEVGF